MKRDKTVNPELQKDIECYICGEAPSPLVMLRAPKLERWSAEVQRRGKAFVLIVTGEVPGHHEFRNGENGSIGAIAWFDRHRRFVRTSHRLYVLGEPEIPPEGVDT